MRIEKGLKSSKIEKITQKTFNRVFLNQKPDVFVKTSGETAKSNLTTNLKNGAKVAVAGISAGLAAIGIGLNSKNKVAECTPEELDKIEYAAEQEKFSYGYDDIKALNYFKQNEPEFFEYLINNVDKIKYFNYTEPCDYTNFFNIYRAKIDDNEMLVYTDDSGKVYGRVNSFVDENGNKILSRKDILVGTDDYKYSTQTTKPDGSSHIIIKSNAVADSIGIVDKISEEHFLNKEGRITKRIEYKSDGSTVNSFYKYDDKNSIVISNEEQQTNKFGKPTEIYTKKVDVNGNIEYEMTKKNEYSYFQKEEFSVPELRTLSVVENIDYKNNTKTMAEYDNDILIKEIRKITNPKNGKVKTEIIEKSDIEGIYNSKIIDENGKEKIESSGIKKPDGTILVEKHFESADGTKTDYVYKSKSKNNTVNILDDKGKLLATSDVNSINPEKRIIIDHNNKQILEVYEENQTEYIEKEQDNSVDFELSYKITDKNGKVLTTVDRIYKQISPNVTYSSLNGHEYTITKTETGVDIRDLKTNDIRTIEYSDLIHEDCDYDGGKVLINKLPADMILNMVDRGIKIKFSDDKLASVYVNNLYIQSSDDLYIFAHESGHSKDLKTNNQIQNERDVINAGIIGTISEKENFLKVFEEEKSAFINSLSEIEKHSLHYFIKGINHITQRINASQQEVMAEINALFSGGLPVKDVGERSHYLQKYFPRTIAMASAMLNPESNIARQ